MTTSLLNFQKGNSKLDKKIVTFSLPSGHTCPFASDCFAKVNRETGKLVDGPETKFRCFAASAEALYPNTRNARFKNFDLLKEAKTSAAMAKLIASSIPEKASMVRVHVAGDFFNQAYFDAWMKVATLNPGTIFYAYTKSLAYWIARIDSIPANFKLTASKGGRNDSLIELYNLKTAEVVFSEEAATKGLEIDHDDSHAYNSDKSFALLLHGTQAAGSDASKALQVLRKAGKGGYRKETKKSKLKVDNMHLAA